MNEPVSNNSGAQPPSNGIEIRIARSISEVENLRGVWTAWGGHRDSDIDVVLTVIDSLPEALRPHVIALYRDGQPVAILIGRLEHKQLSFKVGYITVFRPWVRCLTFVYGAIRGNASPENTAILLREAMNCLKQDEADIAMLEFVPVDSPLYEMALKFPAPMSRDSLPSLQEHRLMLLPGSLEEIYKQLSGSRRVELRRRVRKLEAHPAGVPKIVSYRRVSELDVLFRDAEEIAKKTYQRGLGAGFANTQEVRRRLALAAEKGWLQANLLYLGDRPVAFWMGMIYEGTFVSEYMGYDPEFRQAGPGMVLIMRVLEGLCNGANGERVKELDFGLGDAEYKAMLCSKSWLEGTIFIFSPTLKGLRLKSKRVITQSVDAAARKLLASTKFFSRLKRIWRDRLRKKSEPVSQKTDEAARPAEE